MTKIVYIKPAQTKGYLTLGCLRNDEKVTFTVDEETYRVIGEPLRGDLLDGEREENLTLASERYQTLLCALRILSYADNSEGALCRKLSKKGYSKTVAKETTEEMVRLGYIDEKRQLKTIVKSLSSEKLYGPKKIFAYAVGRGYRAENIRAVLRELTEDGSVDFQANFNLLCEKKEDGEVLSPEERQKYKFRYGY